MGIEKKLIKSITSEFFEKLEKDNGLFFSNFKNSLRVTKSAKKLFERSKTFLKNKTKTNAIHYSEFGTVKKPILGFTLLHATGNYNPQKEWDEETIGAGSWFIEKSNIICSSFKI